MRYFTRLLRAAALPRLASLLLPLALLLPVTAHAGQACSDKAPTPETIRKGLNLALKTREALDASGAQVALVARVGQDLSRYKLRYSHMGYAWRDHPKGRWFVVHELNACGTALSTIYDEGLGNFFLDDLHAYEALVLIPGPELQARLAGQLSRERALAMHQPQYSMVSYAFGTKYQNSNQWALETLAAALAPEAAAGRGAAQAWLRQNGYQPVTLNLGTLTRLGGRMFRANIAFDDHPSDRRFANQIDTVTVEGVAAFVERQDSGAKRQLIVLAP